MLCFVESLPQQELFIATCRGTAFGCKLATLAGAYGFARPFAQFWQGEGLALGLMDGTLSLAGTPQNLEEVRSFVKMLRPDSVFCPARLAQMLGICCQAGGPVLAKQLPVGVKAAEITAQPDSQTLRGMWELLADGGMALEWEGFYLDISHRLRHGAAVAISRQAEGRLAGCALAFLWGQEALLTAVAVRKECRGQGIGSALVRQMERLLGGRRIYLLREAGKNRAFYRRLGYRPVDRWRTGVLKP